MFFLIASLCLLIGSIMGYVFVDGKNLGPVYGLMIIILAVYIWLYYKIGSKTDKQLYNWGLRPTYLCLFGLLVVNFQFFIDDISGIIDISESSICPWADNYFNKVFWGSYIIILCYIIGNYYSSNKFNFFKPRQKLIFNLTPWIALMTLCFICFVLTIDLRGFLTGSVYEGSGASNASVSISDTFEHLFQVFTLIILALYPINNLNQARNASISSYIKGLNVIFWIIFTAYLLLRIPSGDRGPVLYNTMALVYSYILYSKKITRIKGSLILLAIAIFFASIMTFIRNVDTRLNTVDKINVALENMNNFRNRSNASISPLTAELAKSVRCNFVAVRDIDKNFTDYSYGRFMILRSLSSLPGAKTSYFNDMGFSNEEISSAVFITKSYNGSNFYTFGLGSSLFAEAFLELGIIGVILTGLFLGWIMKKVDVVIVKKTKVSPILSIFSLQLACISFYIARSSLSETIGKCIYIIVLFWIINSIFQLLGISYYKPRSI